MTHDQYLKTPKFKCVKSSALVPDNDTAYDLMDTLKHNRILLIKPINPRDAKFHACFFKLLSTAYDFMPRIFKNKVQKADFYAWLRDYNNEKEVKYTYPDGRQWIVPTKSISFSKMNQVQFENYVREQMVVLYDLFMLGLEDEAANIAISSIEEDFKEFLRLL